MYDLDELMNEYALLAKDCYEINYGDKSSVRRNNKAVTRMYFIVDKVKGNVDTISRFKELLKVEVYRTNLWAATQLLEKVPLDDSTENEALQIIQKAASGHDAMALGFQYWLKDWKSRKR